jgi:hypothetical protein
MEAEGGTTPMITMTGSGIALLIIALAALAVIAIREGLRR